MPRSAIRRFDAWVVSVASRFSIPALRIALGIVFLWFGILKVVDASPVADLVADTVPLLSDRTAVVVVGIVEIAVAIGLITGVAIRLTLGVFFLQMLGTFLVLVTQPSLAFEDGNPLRLTVLGEFVVKNVVLLSAGLAVASQIPRPHGGVGEMLTQRARPSRR